MAVSESTAWLRVKMEKHDTLINVVTKLAKENSNPSTFLPLGIERQTH